MSEYGHYIIRNGEILRSTYEFYLDWWEEHPLKAGAELPTHFHIGYAQWPDGAFVSTIFLGLFPTFETYVYWGSCERDSIDAHCQSLAAAEALHAHWLGRMLAERGRNTDGTDDTDASR